MAKLIDKDKLSRFLSKIRTEMSNKVLDTMEHILANTTEKNIAGARGVKELYNKLNSDLEKTTGRIITCNNGTGGNVFRATTLKGYAGVLVTVQGAWGDLHVKNVHYVSDTGELQVYTSIDESIATTVSFAVVFIR